MSTVQAITNAYSIGTIDPESFQSTLSPDALMTYLSTRLGGLDDQIDLIFNQQKAAQRVQSGLQKIQAALARLDENASSEDGGTDLPADVKADIDAAIADIGAADPLMSKSLHDKLYSDGFILSDGNDKYNGDELKATKPYIDGLAKDLESSSQMDMIHLQSLMSSRQTAIQLATNLISALGESSKAIATNLGR